jgi:hypothetical protein
MSDRLTDAEIIEMERSQPDEPQVSPEWEQALTKTFPGLTSNELVDLVSWLSGGDIFLTPPPVNFNPDWVNDVLYAFSNPGADREIPDDFISA